MAISPFDLIKNGITGLINEGKSYFNKPTPQGAETIPDVPSVPGSDFKFGNANSTSALPNRKTPTVYSTFKSIPGTLKKVQQDMFNYGSTNEELEPYGSLNYKFKDGKVIAPVPSTSKQRSEAAKRSLTELYTAVSRGGAYVLPKVLPGYQNVIDQAVKTKTGGLLADIIPKLEKYQQPETAQDKALQREAGLAQGVMGSTRNIYKIIAGTKNPNLIAKELKGLGLADDVIEAYTPSLVEASDPKTVSKLINEAQIPEPLRQTATELEIRREAINNSPLNGLDKRSLFKEGSARELGDIKNPQLADKIQRTMAEAGTIDPTDFANKLDEHQAKVKQLVADQAQFNKDVAQYRTKPTTANRTSPQVDKNPISSVSATKFEPANLGAGEARSLEKMAEQVRSVDGKFDDTIQSNGMTKDGLTPKEVQSYNDALSLDLPKKPPTDVKNKVGWIDRFLRSPENVIRDMGYEDVYTSLRQAKENIAVELPKNIAKVTEIAKDISPESNMRIFRHLDGEAIDLTPRELKAAQDARKIFNDFADRMGLKQDDRVTNYVTHLIKTDKEFPEDIAKLIDDKIPGSVYNPFLIKRTGGVGYKQDFIAALDAYTKRATRKIHMDPALKKLAEVGEGAEKTQKAYLKSIGDYVNMRPNDTDEAVDISLKKVFGYKAGTRPIANISRKARQGFFRGTIGLNVGAVLNNLSQGRNTYAKLGEKYTTIGYYQVARKGVKELEEVGILSDDFVTDRTLSATKKFWQRTDKGLFYLFDKAEKLNRGAAYYGAKAKALAEGKTLDEAVEYAKKIVRETQYQYGALDLPLILQGDTNKLMTQFLSYPIKEIEFMAGMSKGLLKKGERLDSTKQIARYILATVVFTGTIGKLLGADQFDLWDEDLSVKDNLLRIPGNLPKNAGILLNNINPVKRFGLAPALAGIVETGKAIVGTEDKYGNERDFKQKVKDVANATAPALIPAYTQGKKTFSGIMDIINGGSFTKTGEKRFDAPKGILDTIKAVTFGEYKTKGGKAYIDNGFKAIVVPKTPEQINQEAINKLESGEFGSTDVADEYIAEETTKAEKQAKTNRMNMTKSEHAQEMIRLLENGTMEIEDIQDEVEAFDNQQDELGVPNGEGIIPTGKGTYDKTLAKFTSDFIYAYLKDPKQALKATLSPEELGSVEGNQVALKRFFNEKFDEKGGSDKFKKALMAKEGISWEDREDYKLEHLIPIVIGGDNSPENLYLEDTDTHKSYTKTEAALGRAVVASKITQREAQALARKFKVDKTMSAEDVINALK